MADEITPTPTPTPDPPPVPQPRPWAVRYVQRVQQAARAGKAAIAEAEANAGEFGLLGYGAGGPNELRAEDVAAVDPDLTPEDVAAVIAFFVGIKSAAEANRGNGLAALLKMAR